MFKILDHLDKLDNVKHHLTWGSADCPVCGGTLKFSKSGHKTNSYACYTGNCHTIKNEYGVNRIKAKLYVYSPFRNGSNFKRSNIFSSSNCQLLETPIKIEDDLDLISKVEYIPPRRHVTRNNKRYIYFEYDAFTCVRVETITDEGADKYFYQTYVNSKGVTVKGLPLDSGLPVYRTQYLQKDILAVEGEKCASFLQKLGLAAICINTAFISDTVLPDIMQELKNKGVQNILYLPDNDVPGDVKADKIMQAAWKVRLNAETLNLVDYYVEYSDLQGFDIVDLFVKNRIASRDDVLDIVNRWKKGRDSSVS